jgi:uncharacterized protein (TIGR03067 family)
MLLAFLVLGCGKKSGSDANPTPEPNPTPDGQQPAGQPGIEGTYLVVGSELWGEKIPDVSLAKDSELDRTVKISKDQIQFKMFKRETIRYKLDLSKSPKEIDTFSEEPGKKSWVSYGIYKVEGDTLTLFIQGAPEPQLRPREFKTLDPSKGKPDEKADKQVGGFVMLTLKKVSDDTTFISEPRPEPKPPSKPKPPAVDEDGPVIADLTKKGFITEKVQYGKFPGVNVKVPSNLSLETIKDLSGHPRIRSITFTAQLGDAHPVTDEVIRALNGLDGLKWLEFQTCPKLTAAAFRDLSRFPMLTSVDLSYSPVDDAAIEELAKLKTLERVVLKGEKITDKSLAALAKVRTLKSILLGGAHVTASGIKLLNALPDLEELWLQNMPVADAALGELSMPKLQTLNLAHSNVTDEALGKLPVLPALRSITLSGPKLTDTGLKHLAKQPNLEDVTLVETKVTKAAAEELKKLKPKLYISVIE